VSFKSIAKMNVYYHEGLAKSLVGQLAIKDRQLFFEYDSAFLKKDIHLSPFQLPLKSGLMVCNERIFEGLFGVFNDSLPDGWGRLLLDRKLLKIGIDPHQLSPLDRLAYVGQEGMGALGYEPEITSDIGFNHRDLDEIANEIDNFIATDTDQFVEDLLQLNGSSAGARPKILINIVEDQPELIYKEIVGQPWIIKFQSFMDEKDHGAIEYAYHLMAQAAGLDVPQAHLFKSKKGPGYFGVQRFDRENGQRVHMHTLSGLLHVDHRIPSLDYETVLKATLSLTKNIHECEKQLKAALFNILAHNRDDHAKNFSFLMNPKGKWYVSPAYDLTFSSGPAGEHCTTLMGEGKTPTFNAFLKLAVLMDVKKEKVEQFYHDIHTAILKWPIFADQAQVTQSSAKRIQTSLESVIKKFNFRAT